MSRVKISKLKIFLLFDLVHIFKIFYNNLIVIFFECPAFGNEVLTANAEHVSEICCAELGNGVKLVHCLFPSSIEKTNLSLADATFQESTKIVSGTKF